MFKHLILISILVDVANFENVFWDYIIKVNGLVFY